MRCGSVTPLVNNNSTQQQQQQLVAGEMRDDVGWSLENFDRLPRIFFIKTSFY